MMRLFALFLFLLLFAFDAKAQTEAVVDLAEDFIPVTQDFDGAHMTVFGALLSSKSDIVVVFEGPPAKALVRAKIKQMGIWVNGDPETLEPVPSYYAVLSSRPLSEIADAKLIEELGLGVDMLSLGAGKAVEGLKQNRKERGLYIELGQGVKIKDKKLFRADLRLPPNVPIGNYKATIYEIQKGAVKASRTTSFKIAQVGIGSTLKNLATENPAIYAMMSIVLVLSIGGIAAFAFRRMS